MQRTYLSVFNGLRRQLAEGGKIIDLDVSPSVEPRVGDLIEVEGTFVANPFYEYGGLFDMYIALKPFFDPESSVSLSQRKRAGNQNSKQTELSSEEKAVKRMIEMVSGGQEKAGVTDATFETASEQFPKLLLTLKSSTDIDRTVAMAAGAKCSVIGKVTGMFSEGETRILYRNTPLRYFPKQIVYSIFDSMNSVEGMDIDLPGIEVSGPGLQILPLAIFV